MNMNYRSFISEIRSFREPRNSSIVNVWVTTHPEWLENNQSLLLDTANFSPDTLKGIYYYPGKLHFFVTQDAFEIKEIKYVFKDD